MHKDLETVETKKTLVVGATPNVSRYAFIASEMLTEYSHEIVPIGIKRGEVLGNSILDIRSAPIIEDIHTITMYIGGRHQSEYYDYLISLKPKRVIFNPGTENYEFEKMLDEAGIIHMRACTLVLLRLGEY